MTHFGPSLPTDLQISEIITTPYRLPMVGALQWGKHSLLSEAHHVLVKVTLSDGSSGMAEAPPRPTIYGETVQSITAIIAHELAPRLCGESVTQAFDRLQEIKNNQTAKGAVDMAIHCALAHHFGQSLHSYLGTTADRIRVSYILGIGERKSVLAEAERIFEQGVRVLKVKVGRNWQHDLALIDELRTIFGESMALYADANETLSTREAATILRHARDHGLLYCEEPLPIEFIRERATLRAEEIMPLIADDSCFSRRDL
ncbi:MAG: enolase, partial [Caldilineaceae bacterium]|nr:enolase [Caldilineaceae bacterium]